MLHIVFGDDPGAVYDPAGYFDYAYRGEWITDGLSREMIRDVDRSEVVSENLIDSPVLGAIGPRMLSGGAKTLILLAHDHTRVFNASACGDNCAKWILRIAGARAASKRKLTVNLHHVMDFGDGPFRVRVDNDGSIATCMLDLLRAGDRYLGGRP